MKLTKTKVIVLWILSLVLWWVITNDYELRWNWQDVDMSVVHFDKNFLFGVAGAAYQYLGSTNSPNANWSPHIIQEKAGQEFGFHAGVATDFWNHIDDDIALMKKLNIKAFRFSFEWSDIEPEQGVIDYQALSRYHELFEKLKSNGIQPWMTLHHFTHPLWFEKLDGFEQEKNISYFIDFCKRMITEFGDHVTAWSTFNEASMYITQGFWRGVWPPYKKDIQLTATVYENVLNAHVLAYNAMKKIKPDAKIGFVHTISQYDAYNPWNPLEQLACYYLNHMYNSIILDFFAQGVFEFDVPFVVFRKSINEKAVSSLDFFGVNYYSHVVLKTAITPNHEILKVAYRDQEIKTDNDYALYAEGLYRAIKTVSDRLTKKNHIPIYITENGIADALDTRRSLFIQQYLYALYKAIQDGYDVRGYFFWSLLDNFEWHQGYSMKFGLYEVDFKTQKRTLRHGAQPLLDVIKRTYGK